MLKCDFHIHTSEDPDDVLDYDGFDLLDRAAELGYQALAITPHRRLYCPSALQDYARARGILLIPGVEYRIEGKEFVLLGVEPADLNRLKTFEDLMALRATRGPDLLVFVPHPFYGLWKCAGNALREHAELFDAVELCHYYVRWCDRNRPAIALAKELGKPMMACSDIHRLEALGSHYCLIDAPPTQAGVFAAIRAGQVQNVSRPLSSYQFISTAFWLLGFHDLRKVLRKFGWIAPGNRRPSP